MPRKKREDQSEKAPQKAKKAPVKLLTDDEQSFMVMEEMRRIAGEFFDHAVILASKVSNGNTEFYHTTFGNDFAVRGMLDSFMESHAGRFSDSSDDDGLEDIFED